MGNQLWGGDHIGTIQVGGVPISVTQPEAVVTALLKRSQDNTTESGVTVRLINSYSISLANSNADYMRLLHTPGMNLPDGAPTLFFMRMVGISRGIHGMRRVRGPSLFVSTLREGIPHRISHFFLGTTPDTLEKLSVNLLSRWPNLKIGGAIAPDFGPVTASWADEIADVVRERRPDIVWVALGTPKQDFATQLLSDRLCVPVIGVGAAFDFLAGTIPEAPHALQRAGLEWLFRLSMEPRRLWRRYLVGNAVFLYHAVRRLPEACGVAKCESH